LTFLLLLRSHPRYHPKYTLSESRRATGY
jgi:hypothetical protein